jgi:disulfide oxidoreductase YuzD
MELKFENKVIDIKKELTNLDKFVKKFIEILSKNNIKYVIISGYVAIFFNRTRHTEDIDAFLENMSKEKFKILWNDLINEFDCLNTPDSDEAYDYLIDNLSLRFAEKGTIMPNMEIKFPKSKIDKFALASKIKVKVNDEYIFHISNIEMQIAFKNYLGSDKDLEDAKHLEIIFLEYINKERLKYFFELLGVKNGL